VMGSDVSGVVGVVATTVTGDALVVDVGVPVGVGVHLEVHVGAGAQQHPYVGVGWAAGVELDTGTVGWDVGTGVHPEVHSGIVWAGTGWM